MTELNDKASPEGQAVFDALHKTLDCKWVDEVCIVVLEQASEFLLQTLASYNTQGVASLLSWDFCQVRISAPYTATECVSLDGDSDAHGRIVKIVQGDSNKFIVICFLIGYSVAFLRPAASAAARSKAASALEVSSADSPAGASAV